MPNGKLKKKMEIFGIGMLQLTHWGQDKMADIFQLIFSMQFFEWK